MNQGTLRDLSERRILVCLQHTKARVQGLRCRLGEGFCMAAAGKARPKLTVPIGAILKSMRCLIL